MAMHGGYQPTANDTVRPWVTGWLDWTGDQNNTNLLYLLEPRYAVLAQYFGKAKDIYKCPADKYVSSAQRTRGFTSRSRSVSGNIYIGKGNGWATSAPWGSPGGPNNLTIYKGAAKTSDLIIPGPSQTWVYVDEHPDSINDAGCFPPSSANSIPDAPATYHNGACGFAFADGHSEIHKWRGSTMTKSRNSGGAMGVNFLPFSALTTGAKDPDLYWYSYASPRVSATALGQ
jgi:prepilin-type processing-associated H-X9-DG protein